MKKTHIVIGLATMLITGNLYALDLSTSNSDSRNYDEKKDLSNSKSKSHSKTKTKNESDTKTKEKSVQKSKELTKIEQTGSLIAIRTLEMANIEPFKSCQVLSKPRLVDDFGLSCRDKSGEVNSGLCSFLDNAAKSNMPLEDILEDNEVFDLKVYMSCVALTGALIAQDMKDEKFSIGLKDQELRNIFEDFTYEIENSECRLEGSTSNIQCGSVTIKLASEPMVSYSNISLYSNQTFFGYSSKQSQNKSKRVAKTFSYSKSKQKSLALNLSKTINGSKSATISAKSDSAANLSLSKFIPGD